MSIFRQVFSCLLGGSPASSPASTPKPSLIPGFGAFKANHIAPTLSPIAGTLSSPRVSSHVGSPDTRDDAPEFVDRQLGLGVLIAKAIGLRVQLGLVSRCLKFPSEASSNGSDNIRGSRSPSPLVLDAPVTPEKYESRRNLPPTFARSTPPTVYWNPAPPTPPGDEKSFGNVPVARRRVPHRSKARKEIKNLTARYIRALAPTFGMPLPYVEPLPALPVNGPGSQAILDTAPFRISSADTEPAWSPRQSAAAAPAPDVPQDVMECEDTQVQPDDDFELEDFEDFEDYKPSAPSVPQHPDGTKYHILGKLGEGSFGRVMLAGTNTGELVALKVIYKPMACEHLDAEDLYNERDLLALAAEQGAQFVVHLKAAWEEGDNVYYAMPLCTGDLRSRMLDAVDARKAIPEREVKLLCAEMILALEELERLRIVHGDIKPENVLITSTGRAVLTDLGLSQRQPAPQPGFRDGPFSEWRAPKMCGTPGYFAPEVLRMHAGKRGPFTSKADVFSLAVVLIELLSGNPELIWDTLPRASKVGIAVQHWPEDDHFTRQAMRMLRDGLHGVLDGIADLDARDMLSQMLEARPEDRPAPAELLRHPYFRGLNIDDVRAGRVPHDYQPQFFGNLNKIEQDVSFLTWQHLRSKEHAPPPSAPIGPLTGFTWPPAAPKMATWDLPSPEEIENW
ncbi:kinase-like protein [Trametes versicolor FP-101664 SS1]|uniref:kinase-like protein n=1 Tax=Trametes versicolor (strain FP-101664) TaxID=717944 RepID=UPI0004622A21|nr:kinase-like protein [Trametes versicolor FP-101664 SS1]EIW61047.1 kinase-like protein [Trametes versicolor FP-101664 SS1]